MTDYDDAPPEVPWKLLYTRMDQVNSVDPLVSFRFYYVPYSTGASYAYLVFSGFCMLAYLSSSLVRFSKDPRSEVVRLEALDQPDVGKNFALDLPPSGVLLTLSNGTVGSMFDDPAYVTYDFEVCHKPSSKDGGHAEALTFVCTPVTANKECLVGDETIWCPADIGGGDLRLHGSISYGEWRFVRMRVRQCNNATSAVTCHSPEAITSKIDQARLTFRGWSTDPLLALDHAFPYNYSESYTILPEWPQQTLIDYRMLLIHKQPRFIVGSLHKIWEYNGFEQTLIDGATAADGDGRVYAELVWSLNDQKRVVVKVPFGLRDFFTQLAGLGLFVYMLGIAFRWFNEWHFKNFGQFQTARLPGRYHELLLDEKTTIKTPGLKRMIRMREQMEEEEEKRAQVAAEAEEPQQRSNPNTWEPDINKQPVTHQRVMESVHHIERLRMALNRRLRPEAQAAAAATKAGKSISSIKRLKGALHKVVAKDVRRKVLRKKESKVEQEHLQAMDRQMSLKRNKSINNTVTFDPEQGATLDETNVRYDGDISSASEDDVPNYHRHPQTRENLHEDAKHGGDNDDDDVILG